MVLTEYEMKILERLFQHPAGEDAKALIERKFINVSGFDAEPHVHAYNAGQRGLALLLVACASPQQEVVGTEHLDSLDSDNTTE